MVALSVSISTSSWPTDTGWPSSTSQATIVPSSIWSVSAGITTSVMDSSPQQVERGADDRVRVDAEVPVEILDVAGLPEVLDAEAGDGCVRDAADEGQRMGMAVEHRHHGRAAVGREQHVEDRVVALGQPLARLLRA